MTTGPGIQNWKSSICQGSIFPYNSALEETFRQVPWPIQSTCTPWHPFSHPTTPTRLPSSTPGIPRLNVGTSIPESNPKSDSTLRPYPSLSKTNPNLRFPTSLTPRLITDIAAKFNTLSDGWAMKALTKKPLGSMLMNLEMLLNLLQIFTWPILPSQALSQIFEVQTTSLLLKFSQFITSSTNLITLLE